MDPGVSSVQAVKLFTAYKRRMKNAKKRFFFFVFHTDGCFKCSTARCLAVAEDIKCNPLMTPWADLAHILLRRGIVATADPVSFNLLTAAEPADWT